MTKALKMINTCIDILWEKEQWETEHFEMFQGRRDTVFSGKRVILCSGRRDTLFSGKQDILPSGNDFFLWESDHLSSGNRNTYTLGTAPFNFWESDHLSSGIRDILWETGHGKRDMLSSGIRTTYPLGNNLWESGIWEMRYNHIKN